MSSGGYGTPPFPPYYPLPPGQLQTPPQEFTEDDGEFTIKMTTPPWVEAGESARFKCLFKHDVDGVITALVTGPTVTLRDANGNVFSTGITIGTVTADPGVSGQWFVSIIFAATVPAGNYEIQWVGTYTPLAAGSTTQNIQKRRPFRVKVTKAPSQFYFLDTSAA